MVATIISVQTLVSIALNLTLYATSLDEMLVVHASLQLRKL